MRLHTVGRGLLEQDLSDPVARFAFLSQDAVDFFIDWDRYADDIAAALRIEAGRRRHDVTLNELVGELATNSREFAARWARHDVRLHRTTTKRLRSQLVGEIELTGDAVELPGEELTLIAYTAQAGSKAQQLDSLASWSATAPSKDPNNTPASGPGSERTEDPS